MTSCYNLKFEEYGELMTTVQVCKVLFGECTINNRRNLCNYVKNGKFPQPRIHNKNYFLFSNKDVFQFIRYGIIDNKNHNK